MHLLDKKMKAAQILKQLATPRPTTFVRALNTEKKLSILNNQELDNKLHKAMSVGSLKHEGHRPNNDFERIKRFTTKNKRHEVWLCEDKKTGDKVILKNTRLHNDFIESMAWEQVQNGGGDFDSAFSQIKSGINFSNQELRFLAEKEAFTTALMRLLTLFLKETAVPEYTFTAHNFNPENPDYFVGWKYIEKYTPFGVLPTINGQHFTSGSRGETRLFINEKPVISVETVGRIAHKLALGIIEERDKNIDENFGLGETLETLQKIIKDAKAGIMPDEKTVYVLVSIDHEMAEFEEREKTSVLTASQNIASGKSQSAFAEIDLNHLEIANRLEARKKSVAHSAKILTDKNIVPALMHQKFSHDYAPEYKQKIRHISDGLYVEARNYAAANTLLQNKWDGTKEHAETLLQKRYGKDYNELSPQDFVARERGFAAKIAAETGKERL